MDIILVSVQASCLSVGVQSVIYEYCTSCQKRLQWIVQVGAKRGLRKPNMDEVRQAKVTVYSANSQTISQIPLR